MKFDTIRLVGATNVDLPLQGLGPLSPFVLKAADGLGPPEVDVSIGALLQGGGYYQGRRPQNREPVLRIGLQPEWNINQTAEELRSTLYGLLTPKYGALVELHIRKDGVTLARTEGHVKKLEVAAFSKDPEVQVTMACLSPYLKSITGVRQTPPLVVSGGNTLFEIDHIGTAPTGFYAQFQFTAATTGILTISDNGPLGEKLKINRTFAINDILTINTTAGARGIWRSTTANPTGLVSILGNLVPDSDWIQLHSGINPLKISSPAVVFTSLSTVHTPTYWGV